MKIGVVRPKIAGLRGEISYGSGFFAQTRLRKEVCTTDKKLPLIVERRGEHVSELSSDTFTLVSNVHTDYSKFEIAVNIYARHKSAWTENRRA